jgi:cytoskeleton protein RodZ
METDSYSEIGTLLRTAREQQHLSLEQVSQMLHIRVRYFDALESGRLDALPGLTYTKGYLQAYASFLGLDKDEVLRRFEKVEQMLAKKGFYFPQVFSKQKSPNPLFVWGGLLMALLVYILWLMVLQPPLVAISVVDNFSKENQVNARISARLAEDVACLRQRDVLYPPCHTVQDSGFSLLPRPGQMRTVMELSRWQAFSNL